MTVKTKKKQAKSSVEKYKKKMSKPIKPYAFFSENLTVIPFSFLFKALGAFIIWIM